MKVAAIILARGGSKGIPNKNLMNFCGKPLIQWTIETCLKAGLNSIWVSSDSDKILKLSKQIGAKTILRPAHYAGISSTNANL